LDDRSSSIQTAARHARATEAHIAPVPITLLLTGFGPFPGIPVNASALLVARLARAARARFSGVTVRSAIVPTEWGRGPARARAALESSGADVAIHFGVSARAKGFVIERRGENACVAAPDGVGELPPLGVLDPAGPARRPVTLPVAAILSRLKARGLPAAASDDAGGYLCNAVLYGSLALAAGRSGLIAGFVHIPASLAGGGSHQRSPMPGCPLTAEQALDGALEIIAVCLDRR
jgi:pyroglutamyl-peptidase